MLTQTAREKRIRRALAKDGYRLWKVRKFSLDYCQYGPFSVIQNDINGLVGYGMDLDDVERCMAT